MLRQNEIMQTLDMIDHQHLDIRTITMGISLRNCCGPDPKMTAQKISDKICRCAKNLVPTGGGHGAGVRHSHCQQAHFRHSHVHGGGEL